MRGWLAGEKKLFGGSNERKESRKCGEKAGGGRNPGWEMKRARRPQEKSSPKTGKGKGFIGFRLPALRKKKTKKRW